MRIVRYAYPSARSLAVPSSAFARSPWSGFETEIDRLFETALGDFAGAPAVPGRFPVDLYEDKDHTYVRAELPGVDRADLNVEVVEGALTISGTRKAPAHSSGSGQATDAQPAQSFSFSRSVEIPTEVQADKISAAYDNGVLTVTLPKREEAKPKKINIAVS